MSKNIYLEYLRTIVLSFLTAVLVVFIIIMMMINQISNSAAMKKAAEDNAIDKEMIGFLIEKNKYLREEHPEDYKIDSRLGLLYEMMTNYKDAEIEYKLAIAKVPYGEYRPYYDLAILYVKLYRLEEAQEIMDKLGEKPLKKLIKYKAEVYSKIGDQLYDKASYEEAAFKYEKALDYYEVLKNKKKIKKLKGNIASSYVYLSDQKVKEMKIDEAIIDINKARLLVKAPILTYKLGVLLSKTDPHLACECFDEVFKQEPSIINYEEYYGVLAELAADAEYMDEPARAELYQNKIRRLKKYYSENLLSVSDIKISDNKGKIKINNFFKKYSTYASISLENTSLYEINSLYLEFVFKNKDEVVERFFKQIVDDKTPLASGEVLPYIHIKTKSIEFSEEAPKEITVQIFASKKEDSRKLLLDEFTVKPVPTKPNIFKTWIQQYYLKYIYRYTGD